MGQCELLRYIGENRKCILVLEHFWAGGENRKSLWWRASGFFKEVGHEVSCLNRNELRVRRVSTSALSRIVENRVRFREGGTEAFPGHIPCSRSWSSVHLHSSALARKGTGAGGDQHSQLNERQRSTRWGLSLPANAPACRRGQAGG